MKVKVGLTVLKNAIGIVIKTVGNDSSGHQGVKIYASKKNKKVKLTTTDGMHATEISFPASVTESGKAVIRAEKLHKYLSKLDVSEVNLSIKDNGSVLLKSARGQQTFIAYDPEAFPVLPKMKASTSFSISGKVFKEMISSVAFATKSEQKSGTSDKLEGVNIVSTGKSLRMYATDGNTVSAFNLKVQTDKMNVILAKKSLVNATKHVKDDEKVTIQCSDSRFIVKIGTILYHIPLLAGIFPDIKKVMKVKDIENEFTMDRQEFLGLLERSSIILDARESTKGILYVEPDKITLTGKTEDADFNEFIHINGNGDDLDIRFDIKRMTDIIKNIDSDTIRIGIPDAKPMVIRPEGRRDQVCLLAIG